MMILTIRGDFQWGEALSLSDGLVAMMRDHTWMLTWVVLICMLLLYVGYKVRNYVGKSSKKDDIEDRQIIY